MPKRPYGLVSPKSKAATQGAVRCEAQPSKMTGRAWQQTMFGLDLHPTVPLGNRNSRSRVGETTTM